MTRALFSLLLIPIGMACGWALRASAQRHQSLIQRIAILGLNPVAIVTSIWALNLDASGIAALPFVGLGVMAFGLLAGFAAMRLLRMGKDSGTVFSLSSSLTNLGSIGSLAAFLILGEQAFALVSFYKLFEEAWVYGLCFPLAAGVHARGQSAFKPTRLLKDPVIFFSLAAMGLGLALNLSGLPRPEFFRSLNAWIVPSAVFLLLVSIGMKIPEGRKKIPRPALFAFLGIRLILMPAFSLALAMVLGLAAMPDPTIFKVTILLSLMPTAFASLVPPSVYGLDFGLSFGLWIASNLTLAGTLPLLWFLLR